MRIEFLNLDYRWNTQRGCAGFEGTGYHLAQAYLRAALKVAGFESRQHIQRYPGTLPALVRDVLRGRPDVVVLNYGPKGTSIVRYLADALKSARPETHVVFSGASRSDLSRILHQNPTALACLEEGAEADAVGLVQALHDDKDPNPSPGMAFRRGSGEIVAASAPRADSSASDRLPSPYLIGALPATAAVKVGVEISRGGSRASAVESGRYLVHPAEQVVEELRWIDHRLPQEQTVRLMGELFVEDGELARDLCKAVAAASLRYVRPSVVVDCSTADAVMIDELASAGFVDVVYRVDARAIEESAEESELTERVYAISEAAERVGIKATAHVLFSDPYVNPTFVERLVSEVAAICPNFTYDWPVDLPGALPPQEALYLPEILSSRTFQEHRALEQGTTWRFMRMNAGVYDNLPGYAESALELWWKREDPPALAEGWLADALGFDSSLFWERRASSSGAAMPPAPLGEVHPFSARGSSTPGAGYAFDSSHEGFGVRGYAAGSADVPGEPLVLSTDTPEDISKFLEDADLAREKGLFPAALCHPLVVIRDLCRWGGPGQCATPHLPRLFVGPDGAVRPAPAARPVGRVGDGFSQMLDRVRERAEDLHTVRGCDRCPVRAACSRCQCLPEWVPEAEYCSWRQARPWLPLYVSIPAALGRLARLHPELAGAEGLGRLSVSGFGDPLYYDGPRGEGRQAGPLLIRIGEQHYSFDPRTNRLARLTRDLAAICEALTLAPDMGATVRWLSERWKLTSVAATQAAGAARTQLEAAAMMPRAEGSKASGEAPLAS